MREREREGGRERDGYTQLFFYRFYGIHCSADENESQVESKESLYLCLCTYIYIHICMYTYMHIYICLSTSSPTAQPMKRSPSYGDYISGYICIHVIQTHNLSVCIYIYICVCVYISVYRPHRILLNRREGVPGIYRERLR